MKSDVIIQQLFIKVSSGDRSYMPQHVSILAGSDLSDLYEISDVRIPRYISTDVDYWKIVYGQAAFTLTRV